MRFLLWWSCDSIILIQDIVSLGNWIMAFRGNMLSSSTSVKIFNKYSSWVFRYLKVRTVHFLKTLGSNYSVTQHHTPGEWNTPPVLSVCNCVSHMQKCNPHLDDAFYLSCFLLQIINIVPGKKWQVYQLLMNCIWHYCPLAQDGLFPQPFLSSGELCTVQYLATEPPLHGTTGEICGWGTYPSLLDTSQFPACQY